MKKLFVILLFVLCASVVSAEQMQMNYSIEIRTHNNTIGSFELYADGQKWGADTPCDGRVFSAPVQVIRTVNCGNIERGTVDTLAEDMRLLAHRFNDTRVYCMQPYQACSDELKNCKISNAHQIELLENCNGTTSDWYQLYKDSQNDIGNLRAKTCYGEDYITSIKSDYNNKIYWAIGVTALVIGSIAYGFYFKRGLAQMPHHKI